MLQSLCSVLTLILMPVANFNLWHHKSWTLVQFLIKALKFRSWRRPIQKENICNKEKCFVSFRGKVLLNMFQYTAAGKVQISRSLNVNFLHKINLNYKTQELQKLFWSWFLVESLNDTFVSQTPFSFRMAAKTV